MWNELPDHQKLEYKRLILAFASLTEMFAQKSIDKDMNVSPIINSKFQETAFQRAFSASAEDIKNTSYDASLQNKGEKYLVGIKTFGISSGDQKIAQFKSKYDDWTVIIEKIKKNSIKAKDKEEQEDLNHDLYLNLAKRIAVIRNARIDSSYANIKGFLVEDGDKHVHSVYHVLMSSSKSQTPKIYVGETPYDKIDINEIRVLGSTGRNKPTNFCFYDGKHVYKYTSADSQLYMNFNNKDIICDEWDVLFACDAKTIFNEISNIVYSNRLVNNENLIVTSLSNEQQEIEESFCWTIWNTKGEIELYSGFNAFFGTGSKLGVNQRNIKINKICSKFNGEVETDVLKQIEQGLTEFLIQPANSAKYKEEKVVLRKKIIDLAAKTEIKQLVDEINKIVYRPMDEMYIPIPNSARFHKEHPDFFGRSLGELIPGTSKLKLSKNERRFSLIFEPSGDSLEAYITQDNGKAIESAEKQSYLGEWILRGIFQLDKYEPLTSQRLIDLNINGLKFTKYKNLPEIHMEFIWIDEDNPPNGYISRK